MSRSQLRTTSDGRSGDPSENVRPGRRWKVTRRPPSSKRHDSARAGRTCRSRSKVVSDSNSWAVMAALPASPWAAGSRVVGAPVRIRTGRSGPAAGWDPHAADERREQDEGEQTAHRREYRAGRPDAPEPAFAVTGGPPTAIERAWNEASQVHTAGGTMELDREASGRITTADRIRYGRDRNDFDGNPGDRR